MNAVKDIYFLVVKNLLEVEKILLDGVIVDVWTIS